MVQYHLLMLLFVLVSNKNYLLYHESIHKVRFQNHTKVEVDILHLIKLVHQHQSKMFTLISQKKKKRIFVSHTSPSHPFPTNPSISKAKSYGILRKLICPIRHSLGCVSLRSQRIIFCWPLGALRITEICNAPIFPPHLIKKEKKYSIVLLFSFLWVFIYIW